MENEKITKIKQEMENNQYCIKLLENSNLLKAMLDDTERKQLIKTYFKKNVVLFCELRQERVNIERNKNRSKTKTKEKITQNKNIDEISRGVMYDYGILSPVVNNKNYIDILKIYRKGHKISVDITNMNKTECYGTTKCNSNDTFDIEIGFCVAFTRAILNENYKDFIKDIKDKLSVK